MLEYLGSVSPVTESLRAITWRCVFPIQHGPDQLQAIQIIVVYRHPASDTQSGLSAGRLIQPLFRSSLLPGKPASLIGRMSTLK